MMFKLSKTTLKQRGDTIIEVMIAMSILGMVLATAFTIANRSYALGLAARERGEALQIAESQLELMQIASNTEGTDIFDYDPTNPLFCIDDTTNPISRIGFTGTPGEISGNIDPITTYAPGCQLGTSDRFKVSIEQDSADTNTYSIRVRWESVLGGNIEELNHVYRIYDFDSAFSLGATPIVVDECPNLPGIQSAVPAGYIVDGSGNCVIPIDECPNIAGNQSVIPVGYIKDGSGNCVVDCSTASIPQPFSIWSTPIQNVSGGLANSINLYHYYIPSTLPPAFETGIVYSKSPNPTIADSSQSSTFTGSWWHIANISYSNLDIGDTYYFRAYTREVSTGCIVYSTTQITYNVPVPTGYTLLGTYQGRTYLLSNATRTWTQARSEATSLGGYLVTIFNNGENNFVRNASATYHPNNLIWIGLSDSVTEGSYRWVTGQNASYTNWATPTQPDDYTYGGSVPQGEDYMMMYTNDGRWNDLPDFYGLRFVVEIE